MHKKLIIAIFLIATQAINIQAKAKNKRSSAVKHEFRLANPCPSTNQRRGACPGFVVDHVMALCVGGKDVANNLRWQTVEAAKRKDRWECKPDWERHLAACEVSGCFEK